jgi:hypothetical protein
MGSWHHACANAAESHLANPAAAAATLAVRICRRWPSVRRPVWVGGRCSTRAQPLHAVHPQGKAPRPVEDHQGTWRVALPVAPGRELGPPLTPALSPHGEREVWTAGIPSGAWRRRVGGGRTPCAPTSGTMSALPAFPGDGGPRGGRAGGLEGAAATPGATSGRHPRGRRGRRALLWRFAGNGGILWRLLNGGKAPARVLTPGRGPGRWG